MMLKTLIDILNATLADEGDRDVMLAVPQGIKLADYSQKFTAPELGPIHALTIRQVVGSDEVKLIFLLPTEDK